ncbi:MAG: 5-formyltetrahydrofolate cyclo-ligase [Planctomycetota bacterium]
MDDRSDDKHALRRRTWTALRAAGVARFPGAVGRVPNFTGAEAAAGHLAREPRFLRARTLLCGADLAQRPVRYAALAAGKRVYLPTRALAGRTPFRVLDPDRLAAGDLWRASSLSGAAELARDVPLGRMLDVDLVVLGCVATAADGARLGRGAGDGDLAYALLREAGAVGARTPVWTTGHPLQILNAGDVPMERHDVPVDAIGHPEGFLDCLRSFRRPRGVLRAQLPAIYRSVRALKRRPRDPA